MAVDERFFLPIIYVRGFVLAGTEGMVEDPFYGFNAGASHLRQDGTGKTRFFGFEGPLVRLITDYGYNDAYEAGLQTPGSGGRRRPDGTLAADDEIVIGDIPLGRDTDGTRPRRSIWIYRYYDQSAGSFAGKAKDRQEIEESAAGLRQLIAYVKERTEAERVILLAHSTGGLIIRSLLGRIYPLERENPLDHVDKVFTYATPHGGIHFSGGPLSWFGGGLGRAVSVVRDVAGRILEESNIDDFGRRRMYEYLTAAGGRPDRNWDPRTPSPNFPVERLFCLVGTDSNSYSDPVAGAVGTPSDGLVQVAAAHVRGAPRAFVHRSHSGGRGIVNSEEGFQNLERFLFGDLQVQLELNGLSKLTPDEVEDLEDGTVYLIDVTVAVRELPALMHDQQLQHHTAVPIEKRKLQHGEPTPLFRAYLDSSKAESSVRYAIRLRVHPLQLRAGRQRLGSHLEQVPVWEDSLVCDLAADRTLKAMWVSEHPDWQTREGEPLKREEHDGLVMVPVPLPKAGKAVLGEEAEVRLLACAWNYWWDDPKATPRERKQFTRLPAEELAGPVRRRRGR